MKRILIKLSTFFLIIPAIATAGWQVATPQTAIPQEPFFQGSGRVPPCSTATTHYSTKTFPNRSPYLEKPAAIYAISISGSLKENLERIMDRYHWKVVWKAPYDYNFDGRVTGTSLPNVVERLLKPFPLQAVMYMSNRTMLVTERNS